MTDNEIIKALECCINDECEDCPLYGENAPDVYGNCVQNTKRNALDLINRQKAEIERLKTAFEVVKQECEDMFTANRNLMAEIEQWKEEANKYQNLWCEAVEDIQTAKTEVIKEFADRLKDYHKNYEGFCVVDDDDIDNLVKEM